MAGKLLIMVFAFVIWKAETRQHHEQFLKSSQRPPFPSRSHCSSSSSRSTLKDSSASSIDNLSNLISCEEIDLPNIKEPFSDKNLLKLSRKSKFGHNKLPKSCTNTLNPEFSEHFKFSPKLPTDFKNSPSRKFNIPSEKGVPLSPHKSISSRKPSLSVSSKSSSLEYSNTDSVVKQASKPFHFVSKYSFPYKIPPSQTCDSQKSCSNSKPLKTNFVPDFLPSECFTSCRLHSDSLSLCQAPMSETVHENNILMSESPMIPLPPNSPCVQQTVLSMSPTSEQVSETYVDTNMPLPISETFTNIESSIDEGCSCNQFQETPTFPVFISSNNPIAPTFNIIYNSFPIPSLIIYDDDANFSPQIQSISPCNNLHSSDFGSFSEEMYPEVIYSPTPTQTSFTTCVESCANTISPVDPSSCIGQADSVVFADISPMISTEFPPNPQAISYIDFDDEVTGALDSCISLGTMTCSSHPQATIDIVEACPLMSSHTISPVDPSSCIGQADSIVFADISPTISTEFHPNAQVINYIDFDDEVTGALDSCVSLGTMTCNSYPQATIDIVEACPLMSSHTINPVDLNSCIGQADSIVFANISPTISTEFHPNAQVINYIDFDDEVTGALDSCVSLGTMTCSSHPQATIDMVETWPLMSSSDVVSDSTYSKSIYFVEPEPTYTTPIVTNSFTPEYIVPDTFPADSITYSITETENISPILTSCYPEEISGLNVDTFIPTLTETLTTTAIDLVPTVENIVTSSSLALSCAAPETMPPVSVPTQISSSRNLYNIEVNPVHCQLEIPSTLNTLLSLNTITAPLMYELQIPSSLSGQFLCSLGSTPLLMPAIYMESVNVPAYFRY